MIELKNVSLRAGEFSLSKISLEIPQGAHAVLMGRTGSGKTCLLETICGLRRPTAGQVVIRGQDMTTWPPAARGIGYVPQDGVIFTTMRVRDQLGFALDVRGVAKQKMLERVGEVAELLGIEYLLDRYSKGLSGGERQRVALGRAIAFEPNALCLDEPLSALDDETRDSMLEVLVSVRQHTGATILHVTHSATEARALADVVYRIDSGEIRSIAADKESRLSGQEGEDECESK